MPICEKIKYMTVLILKSSVILVLHQEGTSMASLMAGLASQLPGAHLDEGSLAPVGELDPVTGLFYNPSSSKTSFCLFPNYDIFFIHKFSMNIHDTFSRT